MRTMLLLTFFIALVFTIDAQVKTDFNNHELITERGKFSKNFQGKSPYVIPAQDIKALLENETIERTDGKARPFKIAKAINVDIDVVKEAEWTEDGGVAYGKFSIEADGAKSISANFDRFYLPEGTELYVYSENGEMITGPVTEAENNENNFWGTWVYKGGRLTVDLKTPVESKSSLRLHISSIAYGYKDLYVANFGESSACNVNVLCAEGNGWENERNSVALILNGNSTKVFTGALINNTCNLNVPYLLTANHCFEDTPDVGQWKFTFQAWSATCTPSQNANGLTFNGSTLRARHAGSDFCLVELDQLPPVNSGITFSGWSRATTASPSGVSITHPMGDVMKIATYNTPTLQSVYLGALVWKASWASGTVEHGSSGGPLYNSDKRIIGQVKGGIESYVCATNDHAYFGRFDVSWTGGGTNNTRLSNWLDPTGTGAMTTDTRGIGILGPNVVCTTEQYSMSSQNVSWSTSNPSGLSINTTTGEATREGSFSGQVTITATLGSECGPVSFQKNVWVGVTQIQDIVYPSGIVAPNQLIPLSITTPPLSGSAYYKAEINRKFGGYSHTVYGMVMEFSLPITGTYNVKVYASNSCGWSQEYPLVFLCMEDDGMFAVYPNPTDNYLDIDIFDSKGTETESYQITLVDYTGTEVLKTSSKNKKQRIDTSHLKNGQYILRIQYKGEVTLRRIVIDH